MHGQSLCFLCASSREAKEESEAQVAEVLTQEINYINKFDEHFWTEHLVFCIPAVCESRLEGWKLRMLLLGFLCFYRFHRFSQKAFRFPFHTSFIGFPRPASVMRSGSAQIVGSTDDIGARLKLWSRTCSKHAPFSWYLSHKMPEVCVSI